MRASRLLRRGMHLWRHQQSIMTSPAERKPKGWDTGSICEDRPIMHSICWVRNKMMHVHVLSWGTVYALTCVILVYIYEHINRSLLQYIPNSVRLGHLYPKLSPVDKNWSRHVVEWDDFKWHIPPHDCIGPMRGSLQQKIWFTIWCIAGMVVMTT